MEILDSELIMFIYNKIDSVFFERCFESKDIFIEKVIKKCSVDKEFLNEILEVKKDIDRTRKYMDAFLINSDEYDYEDEDEEDYIEYVESLKRLFYVKEFFSNECLKIISNGEEEEKKRKERQDNKRIADLLHTKVLLQHIKENGRHKNIYYTNGGLTIVGYTD